METEDKKIPNFRQRIVAGKTSEEQEEQTSVQLTASKTIRAWAANRRLLKKSGTHILFVSTDSDIAKSRSAMPDWTTMAVEPLSSLRDPLSAITVDSHSEHEKTREFITEKLSDLAEKQDIILAKNEIIGSLKERIAELENALAAASADLASVHELQECTSRICENIKSESEETRTHLTRELADLRQYLSKFAPYKRFFRVTFGLFCFFGMSLLTDYTFRVEIVKPFWSVVGVVLTTAMLVVIYFGKKDADEHSAD
jgi:hypothetical protein